LAPPLCQRYPAAGVKAVLTQAAGAYVFVLTASYAYGRRAPLFPIYLRLTVMATKQARGTKRTCQNCDERFYDLAQDPIICPFCGAKYVIASSPAALAALQAEQRELNARKAKKPAAVEDAEGELPAVEGEEALADVETDDPGAGEDDETFLQEEEEGGDVSNIIGGPAGEGDEEP
jgi:uncharacterized protein (TIGR02300 family)